ncbi:hypothetical protein [Streptomyces sp. NPDC048111]|uniref:hypothetical protein n=1 Tax=Streptomyces sp. NPDC048111 TaxID=3365500 RepID=UPI0037115AE4
MTARETDLTHQRRWIDQWWAVGLAALVVGAGIRLLFNGLDNWVSIVIGAGFYAALFTAMSRKRQRADAHASGVATDDVPVLERRVRREDIPDDPALRQAMLELVRRRLRLMHGKALWFFPVLLVMFAGLGVWLIVSGHLAAGIGWLAFAFVFMGGLAWMRRVNLGRMRRVERRLTERPAPGNADRHGGEQAA